MARGHMFAMFAMFVNICSHMFGANICSREVTFLRLSKSGMAFEFPALNHSNLPSCRTGDKKGSITVQTV